MAHAIEVSNLTKRFGDVLAVDDLSFTVDEGRIVGFLGPNGAGKTTTLRMLLGLVYPTGRQLDHRRRRLSTTWTIRCARVGAVLGRRHAAPRPHGPQPPARARPRPPASPAARATRCSSSSRSPTARPPCGQLLARHAPAARPRRPRCSATRGCSILDEPANGLDPQGIRWLRDFLRSLARRGARPCCVSSHVLAEVSQTADDVVIINRGRSVAQGTLTS